MSKVTSDTAIERAIRVLEDATPSPLDDAAAFNDLVDVARDLRRRLNQREAKRAGISVSYMRYCKRKDAEEMEAMAQRVRAST